MPHFASGIGDLFGGAWSKIKEFTGNIWDYMSNPKELVQLAINKFTDLPDIAKVPLAIAKGSINTVLGGAVEFVKKLFTSSGSPGVESAVNWAVGITNDDSHGYSQDLSIRWGHPDGNPRAINNWDSNAKAGNNSRGLMQVTPTTFKMCAMKGYDKDIFDPLSNIIAGIRWALYAYDSLYAAWPARGYKGYATGIGQINLSDIIKGYAKGGLSKDELGVVNDQTGNVYKELVIPPHGKPFVPEGRNVILPMQKGTKVIPADKTRKFLKNLPHFANGTEDFADDKKSKDGNSIVDGIRKVLDDTIVPYIREMIRILEGNAKSSGTTVTASNKKTTTKYADTVKEIQKAWTDLAKWFETTVVQPIEKQFETMKEQIVSIFNTINEDISKNYEEYSKEWQETLKEIPAWISGGISDSVLEKFETLFSNIQEELTNACSDAQDTLSETPDWIETNVTSSILSKFTGMFEQIVDGFSTMWSDVSLSAGQELVKITKEADDVIEKIQNIIDKAKDAIATLERVTIAQNEANAASVQTEVKQTTTDISNAVQEVTNQLGNSVISTAVASIGGFSNNIPKLETNQEETKKEEYDIANLQTINSKTQKDKYDTAKLQSINSAATTVEKLGTITTNTIEAVNESMEKTLYRLKGLNLSSKIKVKRYATGGFPEDGWFRASHGEIMGQFDNGQSVVANNQQITEGISLAVQAGNQESNMLMKQEISLLQRQNELLMGILEKETGISSNNIAKAVWSEDAIFRKRTGRSMFAY